MIKQACIADLKTIAELAVLLWAHHEIEELEDEMKKYVLSKNAAVFICFDENISVGFAQCSLRNDYVEGTQSSPVGYLEGIYVKPEYRMKGIAKELLKCCENWARNHGCCEFASDCELNNVNSFKFHLNVGFEEANKIICFNKRL